MESFKIVDKDGDIRYKNKKGDYHRTDGPAYEDTNGYKEWCINGVVHREDGPARVWSDGDVQYYLNDKKYSKEEYEQKVVKFKLKRILDL